MTKVKKSTWNEIVKRLKNECATPLLRRYSSTVYRNFPADRGKIAARAHFHQMTESFQRTLLTFSSCPTTEYR